MKKTKALTKVQQLERKIENLEYAIAENYSNNDELFGLLIVFREYLASENYSQYTAKNALNGIFTVAIHNQTTLMDYAGMEY